MTSLVPAAAERRRRRARGSRGAVALEFALTLPLLVMLLLGVTTMGVAYSNHLALTNAVREGARLGAALSYDPNPTAWADSVQARVQQTYFNTGSLTASQICVQLTDSTGATVYASPTSPGTSCGSQPSTPTAATGTCLVQVWASRPQSVILGVFPNLNFSIHAQAVSYYGRTVGSCKAL